MGLFSSQKNKASAVAIPPEILSDVSVNGVKRGDTTHTVPANLPVQPVSTSPFLKGKTENISAASLSVASPRETSSFPNPSTPSSPVSPSQPSSGEPIPTGEIHFTDTPLQKPSPNNPFLSSGASTPEKKESIPTPTTSFTPAPQGQGSSPFARKPDFSQITRDQALAQKKVEPLPVLKNPTKEKPAKKSFPWANLVSLGVFLLILALISGGSWYYLHTRSIEKEDPEVSIEELTTTQVPETPVKDKEILVDQPNYLQIDIETVTLEQIKALLEQEKQKIQAAGIGSPAEYLVIDKNGNPVAFSRFALLVGANTPADLINASLEPFSLYLYLDQGALRLALAVTLKAETAPNFPNNKIAVAESVKKFFYPTEYQGMDLKTFTFKESTYKNTSIFYINLEEAKNYSLDMTSQEGIFTIANSKNALRAVIDKRLLVPEQ